MGAGRSRDCMAEEVHRTVGRVECSAGQVAVVVVGSAAAKEQEAVG